jgi:hypothetical protein
MTRGTWHLFTHDRWHMLQAMTYNTWHLTYNTWHMTYMGIWRIIWYITCLSWHGDMTRVLTCERMWATSHNHMTPWHMTWHMTHDTWHRTYDIVWNMKHDTWHMTRLWHNRNETGHWHMTEDYHMTACVVTYTNEIWHMSMTHGTWPWAGPKWESWRMTHILGNTMTHDPTWIHDHDTDTWHVHDYTYLWQHDHMTT